MLHIRVKAFCPSKLHTCRRCVFDTPHKFGFWIRKSLMVSVNPFRLSVAVISISLVPLDFISVRTLIQKAADSFLPNQSPNTSFFHPCEADCYVYCLVDHLGVLPYLEDDYIHPNNKINGF